MEARHQQLAGSRLVRPNSTQVRMDQMPRLHKIINNFDDICKYHVLPGTLDYIDYHN